jgi:hypothetical protein
MKLILIFCLVDILELINSLLFSFRAMKTIPLSCEALFNYRQDCDLRIQLLKLTK